MEDKEYLKYLKTCIKNGDGNITFLDKNNIAQLLSELLKKSKITINEAINLNKICKTLLLYKSINELKVVETQYYEKFGCKNEIEKVTLELKYLKSKLLKMFTSNNLKKTNIFNDIIILGSMEKNLEEIKSDEELNVIKYKILSIELENNIPIKFLLEANEYFKSKILSISK